MSEPDRVAIGRNNDSFGEITDAQRLRQITEFVNRYEQGWEVPWYGPPVGQVYFVFYKQGRVVGNFYVGPKFFGRDFDNFYSRRASEAEIAELSQITGFPLSKYLTIAAKQ